MTTKNIYFQPISQSSPVDGVDLYRIAFTPLKI